MEKCDKIVEQKSILLLWDCISASVIAIGKSKKCQRLTFDLSINVEIELNFIDQQLVNFVEFTKFDRFDYCLNVSHFFYFTVDRLVGIQLMENSVERNY